MMKDVILIDKPAGWTSFDVVAKIRSELRKQMSDEQLAIGNTLAISKDSMKPKGKSPIANISHMANRQLLIKKKLKVGHAGTLDPFATGLLIILIGDACKKAGEFLKLDKTYEFTAKLGEVSSTGDPEGVITPYINDEQLAIGNTLAISKGSIELNGKSPMANTSQIVNRQLPIETIEAVLNSFTGEITQTPPAFSAIKINGKRAYKLAREGKRVDVPSRKVRINKLEILEYDYPYLKCVCDVSSGTYIRTLVEDIGKNLGVGAYCYKLRRTKIASMKIEDAYSMHDAIDRIVK